MAAAPAGGAPGWKRTMYSTVAAIETGPAMEPARLPAGNGAAWLNGRASFAARPRAWLGALILMAGISFRRIFTSGAVTAPGSR